MSPRRLVACGALLVVAVAPPLQQISKIAEITAGALTEVATVAMKALEQVPAPQRDTLADGSGSSSFSAASDDPFFSPPSSCAAQPAAQPEPTNGELPRQLENALQEMRADVAANRRLVKLLAREANEDDEANEADQVVYRLAHAVHSELVTDRAAADNSLNERPAALAALHRWDELGKLEGRRSGRIVTASQVRAVALLLRRPGQEADVDGFAAFAVRALQEASALLAEEFASPFWAEEEKLKKQNLMVLWSRLQPPASAVEKALKAAATTCRDLLLEGSQASHAAVRAAASAAEKTVCQFVVDAYDALQAVFNSDESPRRVNSETRDPAQRVHKVAKTLLNSECTIQIGPVLRDPIGRPLPAGQAKVGLFAARVSQFLGVADEVSKGQDRLDDVVTQVERLAAETAGEVAAALEIAKHLDDQEQQQVKAATHHHIRIMQEGLAMLKSGEFNEHLNEEMMKSASRQEAEKKNEKIRRTTRGQFKLKKSRVEVTKD